MNWQRGNQTVSFQLFEITQILFLKYLYNLFHEHVSSIIRRLLHFITLFMYIINLTVQTGIDISFTYYYPEPHFLSGNFLKHT